MSTQPIDENDPDLPFGPKVEAPSRLVTCDGCGEKKPEHEVSVNGPNRDDGSYVTTCRECAEGEADERTERREWLRRDAS